MLVVVAALGVLATVPLAVIATTSQLPLTSQNLSWNSAYEAAQAGLDDYVQHLDANGTYAQYNKANTGGNAAFTGWVPVSGSQSEYFEYSPTTTGGALQLTVSGKAGSGLSQVVRTFVYGLTPASTLDDVYWTACESSSQCGASGTIVFISTDVLNGPVFSNDDFTMCGSPTFTSTVQSADAGGLGSPYWQSACSPTAPNFQAGAPSRAPAQNIIVNGVLGDVVPAQKFGCYITAGGGNGTIFTLNGSTLTWSNGTLDTTDGNKGAGCTGTVNFGSLKSAVIYVNGNATITGGTVSGFLTIVASGSMTITGNITYPCADITWTSGTCSSSPGGPTADSSDALGLIALNNISISANNAPFTLDAALLAITGSFQNANYSNACSGTCNTLNVFGSIAQDVRGPVGKFNNGVITAGYSKSYWYDNSLQQAWPPFFIPPASTTWSPVSYAELKPGSPNEAISGT
ncbi:MAG TPA: hypothetical protein VMV14_01015 [Acidimicrobiales bacterium]|nr:hypothetical protein [Acidimicrobiales bacterium]